jgi:hypothetical protein
MSQVQSTVLCVSNVVIDRQRLLRRRREHSRQIAIFGAIGTFLAIAFTLALLIFGGVIEAPFARGFTSPHDDVGDLTAPCLPEVPGQPYGALPVPYDEIDLRVFNASGVSGVATANQTVLGRRGFAIQTVGDWGSVVPLNQLRFGLNGIVAAYTVAAQFPPMQMILDARPDNSVDLVVGENYDRPLETADVDLSADRPLMNIRGCVPANNITKEPVPPNWVPAPEPAPEEAPEAGT